MLLKASLDDGAWCGEERRSRVGGARAGWVRVEVLAMADRVSGFLQPSSVTSGPLGTVSWWWDRGRQTLNSWATSASGDLQTCSSSCCRWTCMCCCAFAGTGSESGAGRMGMRKPLSDGKIASLLLVSLVINFPHCEQSWVRSLRVSHCVCGIIFQELYDQCNNLFEGFSLWL